MMALRRGEVTTTDYYTTDWADRRQQRAAPLIDFTCMSDCLCIVEGYSEVADLLYLLLDFMYAA